MNGDFALGDEHLSSALLWVVAHHERGADVTRHRVSRPKDERLAVVVHNVEVCLAFEMDRTIRDAEAVRDGELARWCEHDARSVSQAHFRALRRSRDILR